MIPASIRYKNPGAMWGGNAVSKRWGEQGNVALADGTGQGNHIAVFPTYVQGICAQIDLWRTSAHYKNKPFAEGIATWSGGNSVESYVGLVTRRVPGMTRDTIMNDAFWRGPMAIPFLKAQAFQEAGQEYPAAEGDWAEALRRVLSGAAAPIPSPTPDVAPPWLNAMRAIEGTHEVAGDDDSPVIMSWPKEIAEKYPEYAAYCRTYTHDSIAWCGLTMAIVMTRSGVKPVRDFLWADNWRNLGTKLDKPRLGCVMTFKRSGGNHVALYLRTEGQYYWVIGGNQNDGVNEERKPIADCTGMMWPNVMAEKPQAPAAGGAVVAGGLVVAGGATVIHKYEINPAAIAAVLIVALIAGMIVYRIWRK